MKERIYTKDIICILIASFFFMGSPMMVTPLITGYAESLGGGAAIMGLIGGLMNLCSLACRPFAGNLADRVTKYRLSFFGAALMTMGSIGYVIAPGTKVLMVARIVHGVGFSCCTVCLSTWMSNMLPREKIGAGMGLYGTMNALSMAISPAIGVYVYQHYGYRIAFVLATMCAVGTMIMIQFVGDKGRPLGTDQRKQIKFVEPKVLPIAAIVALFTIPYYATQSFLVRYTEIRGIDVSVGFFFTFYAIVLLVLRLTLKNYFDKWPYGVFVMGSCFSAFIAMVCLTVMKQDPLMFLAAACMAGGYGLMCSVCQSTALLLAGPEKRGLANGTYYVGLDVGMATGPMIGGFLYGNVPGEWFYPCFMVTIPLIIAVYFVFCRKIGKQRGK